MPTRDRAGTGHSHVTLERALNWYKRMYLIRRFEECAQSLFMRGQISGSIHLCIGQEAVATGVVDALTDQDVVAATYRGHAQTLALGVEPRAFLAELLGRETGLCGGRAGSMNVVSLDAGLIGCFGIVGGSIAAATGAALALKQKGSGVAVAFFGDGALNQAYFHECLNMASVQGLPLILVCENNLYGEFTPMQAVTGGDVLERARAYGIEAWRIDGNDVWEVNTVALEARQRASEGMPVFVEALTYRLNDHARGDPVEYRPAGEMEAWRLRDPLKICEQRLLAEHGADAQASMDLIRISVDETVTAARDAALSEPMPDPLTWIGSEFSS